MPSGEDLDQLLLPHRMVPMQHPLQLLDMGR
jgi:hypothetical protein